MANEQNLRPWKKGQSGNPKGRPRKKSFEVQVFEELAEQMSGEDHDKERAVVKKFVNRLLDEKDKDALSLFLRRVWPEISKHEVSAEVDLSAEMEIAAEDLRRMIGDL